VLVRGLDLTAIHGSWDIVTSDSAKRNCKAIEFGMWVDNSKILTMALGDSMTDVPALTTALSHRRDR
jgi:hypothetical protein